MTKDTKAKWCGALSYFIIGLVWYVLDKNMRRNHLATYNVKQAINFLIFDIIIETILGFFIFVFTVVTLGIGALIAVPIAFVIGVILFILWVIGILNAATGKMKPVPIIGKYAKKYLTF